IIYLPEKISSVIQNTKAQTGVSYPNHETATPHITIYSCKFDESKYPMLVERLRNVEKKTFSFRLGALSISQNSKSPNLFASIGVQEDKKLRELHEKILEIGNELRGDLIRDKDIRRFKDGKLSLEKFQIIKKYGSEYAKEHFNPHITIGEVEKGDNEKIVLLKNLLSSIEHATVQVDKIYLLFSQRTIPDEKKLRETIKVEI